MRLAACAHTADLLGDVRVPCLVFNYRQLRVEPTSGQRREHEQPAQRLPSPPPACCARTTSLTRTAASLSLTIGNRRGTHRPVRKYSSARGWRSESSLRPRLALAGNRSTRYAPAGSSDANEWGSGAPGCFGSPPAVIVHSKEVRCVSPLRADVGRVVEQHLIAPSLVHRSHVSAGTTVRRVRVPLHLGDLRDERLCREQQ
jgi:hypothetical protein